MMMQRIAMAHRRTRRWRVAGLAFTLLLVAGLVAPLTQAAHAAQGSVFRIGYLGPAGSPTANGAQLAIDQINSVGGVRAAGGATVQLELVALEAAPTVESLPAALEELRGQGVGALLGPDTNAQITPDTIAALAATGLPVFTPATQNAMTDVDTANALFRTRAPERVLSNVIAAYLIGDLGVSSVAAVQTEVEFTEALMDFEAALEATGRSLADSIALPGGSDLLDEVPRLLGVNPDAVVMWGAPEDAAALLAALRDAGWGGVFAHRKAEAAVQSGVLPAALGDGVLVGFDTWSYADALPAARIFLRDYVLAFGEVPGPLAVAAYDAVWALRAAMIEGGVTPAGLRAALLGGRARALVQGVLRPADFGNGDLTRIGVVYRIAPRGGSTVVARFDDAERLGLDQAGLLPVPPTPEPTAVPVEPTVAPTEVLEGVWAEVTANVLNVRSGPGFEFDQIGQIKAGERYRVMGASADYSWLVIEYQGSFGWVRAEYTRILGDINLVSVVQSPPTPTPSLPPNPDIVIDAVVLSPSQPIPNKPFTATVTVRNAGGGATGRFAVAATWEPGAVYTSAFVEGLAGGQSVPVQLSGTLIGTGVFQVAVVADLNNEVAELNEGNNLFNVSYRVDYPLLANQVNIQLGPNTQWDMFGGTPDFFWDGYNIAMLNGAQIGMLSGVTYENVHYDMLTPAVINNTTGVGTDKVQPGVVFGMSIPEGRRAVIRVDNRSGETVWLSYRVYNDTP
ncbi:MAG: ABC transporter substrate-binding protein [Chloroflexota bacterium]|jgi:ABC-type branched-subunit amino acid transport system substrate-binding protein